MFAVGCKKDHQPTDTSKRLVFASEHDQNDDPQNVEWISK